MTGRSVEIFGLLIPALVTMACAEPNRWEESMDASVGDTSGRADTSVEGDVSTVDAAALESASGNDGASGSDVPPSCPGTDRHSCGGQCVDLKTSSDHCGACDFVCGAFQACTAGRCSPSIKSAAITGTVPGSVKDVAVGADGSLFVAGLFKGTVDFDPGAAAEMVTAVGMEDIFLSKFRADGSYAWTRTVRSVGDGPDVGTIAGSDGSVALFGSYKGMTEFFAGNPAATRTSQTSYQEGFLMKLTGDGGLTFVRTFGAPNAGYSTIWGADVAADGTIVVAGPFGGPIDIGAGAQHGGISGGYAARFTATGAPAWLQTFAAKDPPMNTVTNAQVPCRGSAGSVWIAGTFAGSLDFDASNPALEGVSPGKQAAYAIRLSASGAPMGGVTIPIDATDLYIYDCAEAAGGALYLSGSFNGGTFPQGRASFVSRPNAGDADGWLAKVGSDLKYEWGTVFGGAGWDVSTSLTPLNDGTVVALGSFSSASLDFNPAGPPDVKQGPPGLLFATRVSIDGSYRGTFTIGPGAFPMHIRPTSDGFSVTGTLSRTVDLDPHPTTKEERTPTSQAVFVSHYRL